MSENMTEKLLAIESIEPFECKRKEAVKCSQIKVGKFNMCKTCLEIEFFWDYVHRAEHLAETLESLTGRIERLDNNIKIKESPLKFSEVAEYENEGSESEIVEEIWDSEYEYESETFKDYYSEYEEFLHMYLED
jgi:hypothetical protein